MTADNYAFSHENGTISRSLDMKRSDQTDSIVLDMEDRHNLFACIKLRSFDKICIFLAEFIGSGFLMFFGCAGSISWGKEPSSLIPGLSFGLVVLLIIQCFGCVSGAHLNPAVTVAALIYKAVTIPMVFVYFVAQLLGSLVGFKLLMLVTPKEIFRPEGSVGPGLCSTAPHEGLTVIQTFALEYLATMVLITICGGAWDPRNSKNQDSMALKFGFGVAVLSITIGPFTGCSMNPTRTFAASFWNGDYQMHWVYWVAPMLSAIITAFMYKGIFYRDIAEDDSASLDSTSLMPLNTKPKCLICVCKHVS